MRGYSTDDLIECEGCGQMHYEDELEEGFCKECLEDEDNDDDEDNLDSN